MARGLNKVMVIGNIGRDPELRYTSSGKPVTSFSLASSRSWTTSKGDRREETEWFNVVAWGHLAEICSNKLSKSQQVYVEGRLQTRNWHDDAGQRHFRTEIVANEMIILGPRKSWVSSDNGVDDYNIDDDENNYDVEENEILDYEPYSSR
jgi:single-strand DNA-binding protein